MTKPRGNSIIFQTTVSPPLIARSVLLEIFGFFFRLAKHLRELKSLIFIL